MTTEILRPLTPASPGIEERLGVAMSHIGVDGEDLIALGQNGKHLPRERVLAAMTDLDPFTFDPDFGLDVDALEERWAVTIPCDGQFCESDCDWHIQWSAPANDIGPETAGAFPITVYEA